jgi:hypothetical protein
LKDALTRLAGDRARLKSERDATHKRRNKISHVLSETKIAQQAELATQDAQRRTDEAKKMYKKEENDDTHRVLKEAILAEWDAREAERKAIIEEVAMRIPFDKSGIEKAIAEEVKHRAEARAKRKEARNNRKKPSLAKTETTAAEAAENKTEQLE